MQFPVKKEKEQCGRFERLMMSMGRDKGPAVVLRWYLSFHPSLQGWDQKKPVLKGMRTHRPYTIGPT